MRTRKRVLLFLPLLFAVAAVAQAIPSGAAIEAEIGKIMTRTHAKGMAVAVIDHGKVRYVHAYGIRNAKGDPLNKDTMMYGASLTKTVFAYTVMQLVDQGKLNLDRPIKEDLDKPLPNYSPDPVFPGKYGPYKDLAENPRWEKITPRMCLTHSTGFSNFSFLEPDKKLHIHFEPGSHYSYSGEGFILLQFVIEHGRKAQGLGVDVGDLANANFDRLGMTRTGLVWREAFATNVADGECEPGDILVLLTDGFTEFANRSGDELGFLPLESLIVEQAGKPLSQIAQSMYDLVQGYGKQADDQTVLLIRRSLTCALTQGS